MRSRSRPSSHRQLPFERRVDGVDYGMLDDLVGYALRRAQLAIYDDFETALDALDIAPQRFAALVLVAANPGLSQALLGRVLGIARSGTVQVVRRLEANGWVRRVADDADARTWRLTLTATGRSRLTAARRLVRVHERRITRALTAAELTVLSGLLERLGSAPGPSR